MTTSKSNKSGSSVPRRINSEFDKDLALTNVDVDSANLTSEIVVNQAYQCIENHPHLRGFLFAIKVTYSESDSILNLVGSLPSFFLKQMLQSALRELDGVRKIQNEVKVSTSADPFDWAERV